jgi:hypothetical protein
MRKPKSVAFDRTLMTLVADRVSAGRARLFPDMMKLLSMVTLVAFGFAMAVFCIRQDKIGKLPSAAED